MIFTTQKSEISWEIICNFNDTEMYKKRLKWHSKSMKFWNQWSVKTLKCTENTHMYRRQWIQWGFMEFIIQYSTDRNNRPGKPSRLSVSCAAVEMRANCLCCDVADKWTLQLCLSSVHLDQHDHLHLHQWFWSQHFAFFYRPNAKTANWIIYTSMQNVTKLIT